MGFVFRSRLTIVALVQCFLVIRKAHPGLTSSHRSSHLNVFFSSFRLGSNYPHPLLYYYPAAQAFRLRFSLKFKHPRSLTLESILFSTRTSKMDQTGPIAGEKLIRVDKLQDGPSSLRIQHSPWVSKYCPSPTDCGTCLNMQMRRVCTRSPMRVHLSEPKIDILSRTLPKGCYTRKI